MATRLRIIVSGMVAGDPWQGGATWAVLQYVLGLRRLGHDVRLVEPVASLPGFTSACYFEQVMRRFGLTDLATLLHVNTLETVGPPYSELRRYAGSADLLLNVSGMLEDEGLLGRIPTRVYLDLDPAFVQLWHAAEGIDMRFDAHTQFVTVGTAIGTAECPVPTCGRAWIPTLQPVVLAEWPVAHALRHDALTTIGNWRGYGSIEHEGIRYGQKAHSFRELFPLPRLTGERFAPAMAIHPAEVEDIEALRRHGWGLLDPRRVAGTPDAYRRFIQGSRAELGVAKSGYVLSRCGWFSDRSCCYLASGRPVVAQDTGFSRVLPTGEGLLAFATLEDAAAAVASLRTDYARHSVAARNLAEEFFDSDRVLGRLLERLGFT